MKTLIAYSSKTGTTAKCAALLCEKIPGAVLCDLRGEKPDPSGYDTVIVGGSIRAGVLSVGVREYLVNCKDVLLNKKLGLFICSGDTEKADEAFEKNVPAELVSHAICKMSFGGEIAPERAHGFEKMMMKLMLKSAQKDGNVMKLRPERIGEFTAKMLDI